MDNYIKSATDYAIDISKNSVGDVNTIFKVGDSVYEVDEVAYWKQIHPPSKV